MTTKTTKLVDPEEKDPGRKQVTDVNPGCISFQMTEQELAATIELLQFAKTSFGNLAAYATSNGDDKQAEVYLTREEISAVLLGRYKALAVIGEPKSRDVH